MAIIPQGKRTVPTYSTPTFILSKTLYIQNCFMCLLGGKTPHQKQPVDIEGNNIFYFISLFYFHFRFNGICIIKNVFASQKSLSHQFEERNVAGLGLISGLCKGGGGGL